MGTAPRDLRVIRGGTNASPKKQTLNAFVRPRFAFELFAVRSLFARSPDKRT